MSLLFNPALQIINLLSLVEFIVAGFRKIIEKVIICA